MRPDNISISFKINIILIWKKSVYKYSTVEMTCFSETNFFHSTETFVPIFPGKSLFCWNVSMNCSYTIVTFHGGNSLIIQCYTFIKSNLMVFEPLSIQATSGVFSYYVWLFKKNIKVSFLRQRFS